MTMIGSLRCNKCEHYAVSASLSNMSDHPSAVWYHLSCWHVPCFCAVIQKLNAGLDQTNHTKPLSE